uniref:Na_Ca_ex domain-containing protein n=1 Tax=Elaeophora elaphi TaxID=1147741 RepID=A0A0R3RPS6_9BILA
MINEYSLDLQLRADRKMDEGLRLLKSKNESTNWYEVAISPKSIDKLLLPKHLPLVRMFKFRRLLATTSADRCSHSTASSSNSSSSFFPQDYFTLEQRRRGALLLHLFGLIYMFIAISIVSDEFFIPSLGIITGKLSISNDVAGATFMAAGGSAPEFFTSLFGVFITQNNVGIGTIVGSATFNILCVLAFCTLFSQKILKITWWPMVRDISFYMLALFLLVLFFLDEKIQWYEALSLLIIYIIYGIAMSHDEKLEDNFKCILYKVTQHICPSFLNNASVEEVTSSPSVVAVKQVKSISVQSKIEVEKVSSLAIEGVSLDSNEFVKTSLTLSNDTVQKKSQNYTPNVMPEIDFQLPGSITTFKNETNFQNNCRIPRNSEKPPSCKKQEAIKGTDDEMEVPVNISWPSSTKARLSYLFLAPIMLPLYYTLPDSKKSNSRKYFMVTFMGSILWIAFFSYLMVWWARIIGQTLAIPDEIMGLTVLAAGTSIPDLITSVIVARKGHGDMAVSSSIGSNLFDICVGLPVPWLLQFAIRLLKNSSISCLSTIPVISKGLVCSVGLLFLMLIVLIAAVKMCRWKMNKIFGLVMIIAYLTFCLLGILLELGYISCPLAIACK